MKATLLLYLAAVLCGAQQTPEKLDARREATLGPPSYFVPIAPCRIADTRQGEGKSGSFGPPILEAGTVRTIPAPVSNCSIPAGAVAYSLNITVVPSGSLSYLTVYPTGQPRPNVSTLNSFDGSVVANATTVPAGVNGAIDIYATDRTHVIVDINGYLTNAALQLKFNMIPPCRVVDTRPSGGKSGSYGPPTLLRGTSRDIPILQGGCGIPATARAYLVNVTVVPSGPLAYLTLFPSGQPIPLVSTLNSFQGRVVSNMAIVPAGAGGSIGVFASDTTDVILDLNGYLAP